MSIEAGSDARLLETRAARYRVELDHNEVDGINEERLVVFRRLDARYAIALIALDSVHLAPVITPVPGVSGVIKGVFAAQGRLVSVHDLASLGRSPEPLGDNPWLLVVRARGGCLALLSDEIEGTQSRAMGSFSPPPLSFGELGPCFFGVDETGLALIDVDHLIHEVAFFNA